VNLPLIHRILIFIFVQTFKFTQLGFVLVQFTTLNGEPWSNGHASHYKVGKEIAIQQPITILIGEHVIIKNQSDLSTGNYE
jgi:hypothetical protein